MLFETIKVVQLSMCVIMGIHDCPNIKQVEMENEWTPAYYYYSDGEAHIHYDDNQIIDIGIITHELSHHLEETQGKDFKKTCIQYGGTNCDIHDKKK
tara:strand:+ start:227 stop:517 length:291 start_codon:yes stop_codon:yes gene_type:complete